MDSIPAYLHLPNVNKLNQYAGSQSNESDLGDEQLDQVKLTNNSTYALHQSILDGRIKQINYFLKMGLKVNSKDKYGRTSLMLACLSDHEEYGLKVAKLLIKRGADLNVRDSLGRTVVFMACSERREKLFFYLMDEHSFSIDFRIRDNDGNVLLNHVALHGSNKMLKKVIEKMKERHIELDHRNNSGYSALLLAIQNDKFLNAYTLIRDGNSSPSIQDNEKYYNALEWLVNRIEANKSLILGNKQENYDSFSSSTISGYLRAKKNIKNDNLNYKSWYTNNNQYFLNDISCEHTDLPNYSTDYHKSRFVPLILKPRVYSTVHMSTQQQITPRYLPILSSSVNSSSSKENLSDDFDENNLDLKELVQKLYETIYLKMSESYNKSKQGQLLQSHLENEKQPKANTKTKPRSVSIIKENSKQLAKLAQQLSKTEDDQPLNKLHKIDTNIFNLDSLRQTPKLIALVPAHSNRQSTKEAVHSMLDMYEWSTRHDLFQSKSASVGYTPSLDKSRPKSIMHSKEKSNLSNKTNNSANNNRVKFHIEP